MAKRVTETMFIVSLAKGETDGREYILGRVNGDTTSGAATIILRDGDDRLTDVDVEAIPVSPREKRVWTPVEDLTGDQGPDKIDLGKGQFFSEAMPAPLIRVYEIDGETRYSPQLSISGVLLESENMTIATRIDREMARMCANEKAYLPVKGRDYSRWRLPRGTWEEYDEAAAAELGAEDE